MPLGMNLQNPGIEWTRPYGRPGYTLNAVSGCIHDCEWEMSDGKIAKCYAKEVAEGVASAAYPHGFKHLYTHPERLASPAKLKEPAGIFIDSMSDLLAHNVGEPVIGMVIDMVRNNPQHIFFLLTKNPPRLQRLAEYYKGELPSNLWAGISMPPSFMFGNRLSLQQQTAFVYKSLEVFQRMELTGFKGVRWMSFEPLSFNVAAQLMEHVVTHDTLPLEWAVIGAASAGKTKYQPDKDHVHNLIVLLDKHAVPIFFKGNLRGNEGVTAWREEFPTEKIV